MADENILTVAENENDFINCLEQLREQYWNASSIASKSLFNVTVDKCDENKEKTASLKAYEERLANEMKDWKNAYYRMYHEMKKAEMKHPVLDKSILPSEFVLHLETAPCLQTFLRESLEFRQKAYIFQELECNELIEAVENLQELYERKMSLIKANKIAQHLANIKTS